MGLGSRYCLVPEGLCEKQMEVSVSTEVVYVCVCVCAEGLCEKQMEVSVSSEVGVTWL